MSATVIACRNRTDNTGTHLRGSFEAWYLRVVQDWGEASLARGGWLVPELVEAKRQYLEKCRLAHQLDIFDRCVGIATLSSPSLTYRINTDMKGRWADLACANEVRSTSRTHAHLIRTAQLPCSKSSKSLALQSSWWGSTDHTPDRRLTPGPLLPRNSCRHLPSRQQPIWPVSHYPLCIIHSRQLRHRQASGLSISIPQDLRGHTPIIPTRGAHPPWCQLCQDCHYRERQGKHCQVSGRDLFSTGRPYAWARGDRHVFDRQISPR